MVRFTIFGIPVVVQPFFWITLALLGGALNTRTPDELLRLGLFLLAGFISILVHELGHALTARRFGSFSEITLQAFGGYATFDGARMSRRQAFLITAAGPAIQIALGAILWFTLPFLSSVNPNMIHFLLVLMWISIFWAVLNLLPVLPLDGGQMLNAILGPRRIRTTLWVSIIASLIAAAVWFTFMGGAVFSIFLCFFAWQAWQALRDNRFP